MKEEHYEQEYQKRIEKTKSIVWMGVFLAILIIQSVVPVLGYIPLGFMNATIVHITVIIGAIILGPKNGALLGFFFGMSSMLKNTYMPNATSFVFSPFVSVGGYHGDIRSLVVCFVPRILVGIVAYYVYMAWKKKDHPYLGCIWAGALGSMTNTILVMSFIYLLFGTSYAEATKSSLDGLILVIMGIIGTQGVMEAIASAIITLAVVRALKKA